VATRAHHFHPRMNPQHKTLPKVKLSLFVKTPGHKNKISISI